MSNVTASSLAVQTNGVDKKPVKVASTKVVQPDNSASKNIPLSSFKLVARISNSSRLSDAEKSGLLQTVSLVDNKLNPMLRNKSLDSISAITNFMEKTAPRRHESITVNNAVSQYNKAKKQTANQVVSQANIQEKIAELPKKFRNTELNQVVSQNKASVVRIFETKELTAPDAVTASAAKPLAQEGKPFVTDKLPSAEIAVAMANVEFKAQLEELKLPGDGGGEELHTLTLPGSGSEELQALDLPGGGEAVAVELALPGGGYGGEAAVAVELTLPGSGNVTADLEILNLNPLPLPGNAAQEFVAVEELDAEELELPGVNLDSEV